ncbi:MAG: ATP-binding cassette domain-containing protein [Acidobacteriota bacterium]
MIELRALTYRYPGAEQPVIEGVDLRIEESELVVVTGPSGSGKSSLLRTLNGLVPHFHGGKIAGEVEVAGRDPIAVGPRGMSNLVGFVHQNPEAHFVTQVVEDELAFAMENHGLDLATMRRRVEEVLDQLAIAHLRQREIDTLSGGERQRVAIAGVLTLQPRILVLDEPTSQLDPQSASEVLAALRALNDDLGLTLILAEHRLERVAQHADRVLLLEDGKVAALGPPGEALAGSPLAPPLVQLAHALGWPSPTLTLKETRRRPELRRLRQRLSSTVDPESPAAGGKEPASEPPAIEAQGLWWTYPGGVEGLKGLDLEAPRGSLTALLGRNGAGKSTLLRALVGLIRPDRGRIRLRPTAESSLDPLKTPLHVVSQEVGFVPQNPSRLLFRDSVDAEVEWSLRQRGRTDDAARQAMVEWLDTLRLSDFGDRHPRESSTGERQRLALATAFAGDPSILLLDEPTRGLDVEIKHRLAAALRHLCRRGVTVVMATHDVELVAECADRVALLGGGRLVAEGPTRTMLHGSPVFSTRINRLFGEPDLHTLEDVLQRRGDRPPGGSS